MSDDDFDFLKTEAEMEMEREKLNQLESLMVSGDNEMRVLQQKLDEAEAEVEKKSKELGDYTQNLEEKEAVWEKERKKFSQLTTLLANVYIRSKRTRIALELPNFAKLSEQEEFHVYSNPVDLIGFQWKLHAQRIKKDADWLGLFLHAYPPENYKGPYEFDVSECYRLLNVSPGKDSTMHGACKFKRDDMGNGWGFDKFMAIKKLLDKTNGFVQPDGSVLLEVDFTIETATIDHYFVEAKCKEDVKDSNKDRDVSEKKDGN